MNDVCLGCVHFEIEKQLCVLLCEEKKEDESCEFFENSKE